MNQHLFSELDTAGDRAFAAIMAEARAARARDLRLELARDARRSRRLTVMMTVLSVGSFLAGVLFHGGIR